MTTFADGAGTAHGSSTAHAVGATTVREVRVGSHLSLAWSIAEAQPPRLAEDLLWFLAPPEQGQRISSVNEHYRTVLARRYRPAIAALGYWWQGFLLLMSGRAGWAIIGLLGALWSCSRGWWSAD